MLPAGVVGILVTVNNVEVHREDTAEGSWIPVLTGEQTFDLAAIPDAAETFLGETVLEPGVYTQIRLDVTSVLIRTDTGDEFSATLPSDKLKLVRQWEIRPLEKTILTLDFDPSEFVNITGAGEAKVNPVIRTDVTYGERPLTPPEEVIV